MTALSMEATAMLRRLAVLERADAEDDLFFLALDQWLGDRPELTDLLRAGFATVTRENRIALTMLGRDRALVAEMTFGVWTGDEAVAA